MRGVRGVAASFVLPSLSPGRPTSEPESTQDPRKLRPTEAEDSGFEHRAKRRDQAHYNQGCARGVPRREIAEGHFSVASFSCAS